MEVGPVHLGDALGIAPVVTWRLIVVGIGELDAPESYVRPLSHLKVVMLRPVVELRERSRICRELG